MFTSVGREPIGIAHDAVSYAACDLFNHKIANYGNNMTGHRR